MLSSLKITINPFTVPACKKCPGCKMHRRAFKECIFQSCNTSTFNAVCFDKIPFTCQREKEDKGLKGLKFHTFIGNFKWHHGSEGVKKSWWQMALTESPRKQHSAEKWALHMKSHFQRLRHTQVLSLYVFKLHICQINVTSIWWQKQLTETPNSLPLSRARTHTHTFSPTPPPSTHTCTLA